MRNFRDIFHFHRKRAHAFVGVVTFDKQLSINVRPQIERINSYPWGGSTLRFGCVFVRDCVTAGVGVYLLLKSLPL